MGWKNESAKSLPGSSATTFRSLAPTAAAAACNRKRQQLAQYLSYKPVPVCMFEWKRDVRSLAPTAAAAAKGGEGVAVVPVDG